MPHLHRHMHLRAPTAFAPVIARPRATFGRRLRGRLSSRPRAPPCAPAPPARPRTLLHDSIKHPGFEPALALLVHRMPGEQVMGHHPGRGARPDDPAQAIEDLQQAMLRWGASSVMRVRYGATKANSSSLTSLGYALRSILPV